jgi:glycosyltransferase involved in cell wall biosynthesis
LKKAILFVSQQFPYPLTDGGNIRTFKLLEALAAKYDVCLIASVRPNVDIHEGLRLLKGICSEVICVPDVKSRSMPSSMLTLGRALLRNLPLAIAYNFNPHIQREVTAQRARKVFSAVHMNHLDTVQYFPVGELTEKSILDSHNLLHLYYAKAASIERSPWKRMLLRLEAWRMRRYELRVFAALDHVVVCSELEKSHLAEISETDKVCVVPNGVDCKYFHPPLTGYERNPATIVFTGAMGYSPNSDAAIYFIREVMPILREKVPGVRFAAVGRDPPAELLALGSRWADVVVTGRVADVREHVWAARVFVVPIRKGAGTRLKVLEAFAMGIPTVSTSMGAEGIEFSPGQDLLLGDDSASIADRIVDLLRDPARCEALAKRAIALVRSRYDWKVVTAGLLEAYERWTAPCRTEGSPLRT